MFGGWGLIFGLIWGFWCDCGFFIWVIRRRGLYFGAWMKGWDLIWFWIVPFSVVCVASIDCIWWGQFGWCLCGLGGRWRAEEGPSRSSGGGTGESLGTGRSGHGRLGSYTPPPPGKLSPDNPVQGSLCTHPWKTSPAILDTFQNGNLQGKTHNNFGWTGPLKTSHAPP